MEKVIPKLILLVVYETKKGDWRGFCAPYDVTCEASSKNEAKKKIEDLVALYDDGLKKYDYPKHLSVKELSDPMDRKVLRKVLEKVSKDMANNMKKDFAEYQSERKAKFTISDELSGCYYRPPAYA